MFNAKAGMGLVALKTLLDTCSKLGISMQELFDLKLVCKPVF
jgi:hypothetical protein